MIILKNENEIDLMRKAGKILGETLNLLKEKVRPGITTTELDRIAEEFITKHGATPSKDCMVSQLHYVYLLIIK